MELLCNEEPITIWLKKLTYNNSLWWIFKSMIQSWITFILVRVKKLQKGSPLPLYKSREYAFRSMITYRWYYIVLLIGHKELTYVQTTKIINDMFQNCHPTALTCLLVNCAYNPSLRSSSLWLPIWIHKRLNHLYEDGSIQFHLLNGLSRLYEMKFVYTLFKCLCLESFLYK